MGQDEPSAEDAYVEVRIPAELRDRLEALFRRYRGYDPASVQECLSVAGDLAERELDRRDVPRSDASGPSRTARHRETGPTTRVDRRERKGDAEATASRRDGTRPGGDSAVPAAVREAIDAVFPTDWATSEKTERLLPAVVARYVAETDAATRIEREQAALSSVAACQGTTPEVLRDALVDDLYGSTALPGNLAAEFFSEALENAARRIDVTDAEAVSAIDLIDPPAGASGAGHAPEPDDATALDGVASDGGSSRTVADRVDALFTGPDGLTEVGIESLVEGSTSDCERCGSTHPIEVLETTTEATDDRRVDLVCPDCLPECEPGQQT